MQSQLNPYLNFVDGQARAAMEFYQSVFGGQLNLMTFGDMGTEGPAAVQIMHGQLETPAGFTLMGADAPAEFVQVTVGDNMSVSLSGTNADELRGWFNALMTGGSLEMPLAVQAWGDEFGSGKDQFGIPWLVNIGSENAEGTDA